MSMVKASKRKKSKELDQLLVGALVAVNKFVTDVMETYINKLGGEMVG